MNNPLPEDIEQFIVDRLCDHHERLKREGQQSAEPVTRPDSTSPSDQNISDDLKGKMKAWLLTLDALHLAARDRAVEDRAASFSVAPDLIDAGLPNDGLAADVKGSSGSSESNTQENSHRLIPRRIDRFEITGTPLAGGFGLVFPALDPRVQRPVAIKIPKPEFLGDSEQMERFVREARACSQLNHLNILQILESRFDGLTPFIVMPWVTGPTMASWRRSATGITPKIVADLIRQLAEGTAHAHQRGILHRDIKPGNVLLTPRDQDEGSSEFPFIPQLADFGLALFADADSPATAAGAVMGTAGYMAPEQRRGQRELIGPASDIYSLGAVLYFLLTGTAPPDSDVLPHAVAVLPQRIADAESQASEPSGKPSVRIPADLAVICQKCLATSPADRYFTARELAEDLKRFLDGRPILARPAPLRRRIIQWTRRYPAWTAFAVVTFFSSLLILIMSIRHGAALNEQLTISEKARKALADQERLMRQRAYSADMSVAWRAWNRGEVGRTLPILERYRNPADNEDVRDFSWWLLWREYTENSRVIGHHAGGVMAAAMTHDGRLAFTGGRDGVIRCWSLPEGELRTEIILDPSVPVRALQLSPDESQLLSAGDDGILRFWDTSTLKSREKMGLAPSESPRNTEDLTHREVPVPILSHSNKTGLAPSKSPESPENPDRREVPVPIFSHSNKMGLAPSKSPESPENPDRREVPVPFLSPPSEIRSIAAHTGPILTAAFSPDGTLVASGGKDQVIRLWDVSSGSAAGELKGHSSDVNTLSFHPTQPTLFSGGRDESIRAWDVTSLTPDLRFDRGLLPLTSEEGWPRVIVVSPDGDRLLATTNHVKMLQWSLGDAEVGRIVPLPPAFHRLRENSRALIWPGRWTPIWACVSIQSGDPESELYQQELHGHLDAVLCLAASEAGNFLISGSTDGEVRFWPTGRNTDKLDSAKAEDVPRPWRNAERGHLELSSDICVWMNEQKLILFSTLTGDRLREFPKPNCSSEIRLAPDGSMIIAWLLDNRLASIDLKDLSRRWERSFEQQIPWQTHYYSISRDSGSVTIAERKDLLILDAESGQTRVKFSHPAVVTDSVFYKPDNRNLFAISGCLDGRVRIWNLNTGELHNEILAHGNRISSVAISGDQTQLATSGDDRTVRIWKLPDMQLLSTINSNASRIRFFNGTQCLVCFGDETVVLRINDQSERMSFPQTYSIGGFSVSPDGSTFGIQINNRIRLIRDREPANQSTAAHTTFHLIP